MLFDIGGFSLAAIVVFYCGSNLSWLGDRLSDLTGLGRALIGLVLLSFITSLPELLSGISSIFIVNNADLAAGDILGSCAFNLLILSVLDILVTKPLTSVVKSDHMLAGLFGIILLSTVAIAIITAKQIPADWWLNPFSILIIILYFFSIRASYSFTKKNSQDDSSLRHHSKKNELRNTISLMALNACIVIIASLFLPYYGNKIAESFGIGKSFFGTLFLAASTSLPEFVVSLSAIRIGAYDMSVGNLVGSNIFNMMILVLDDIMFTGNFFASISSSHLTSVIATIMMTAIIGINLLIRFEKKILRLSLDAIAIMFIYICLIVYLYNSA